MANEGYQAPTLLAQKDNQLFPPGLGKSSKFSFLKNMKDVAHCAPIKIHSCSCRSSFSLAFTLHGEQASSCPPSAAQSMEKLLSLKISVAPRMMGKRSEIQGTEVETTKSYKRKGRHQKTHCRGLKAKRGRQKSITTK